MSASILPFIRPPQDAMFAVHSIVPPTALTAELLGTERNSHAVQITADGLLLTVGYSVLEASELWLTNRKGQTAEGMILAQDYDSGIALLKSTVPLGLHHLPTTGIADLKVGEELFVLAAKDKELHKVNLFALEEFAGRWEYLLDTALYTQPLFERWSGAALLNADGQLVGIGSLALGLRSPQGNMEPGNLFIPVELVMPHLSHLQNHGQKTGQPRAWLGAMVEEHKRGVYVVGIYHNAPAAKAGLRPGDIIIAVDGKEVHGMAQFFRTVWQYGPAGTAVPLQLLNGKTTRDIVLTSIDRDSFFLQYAAGLLN